jgi:hypothetical protein
VPCNLEASIPTKKRTRSQQRTFAPKKLPPFFLAVVTGCATLIYVDAAKELVEIKPNTSSYTE